MISDKQRKLCKRILKKSCSLFPEITDTYRFCRECGDLIEGRTAQASLCLHCALKSKKLLFTYTNSCKRCKRKFEDVGAKAYCPECAQKVRKRNIKNALLKKRKQNVVDLSAG